MNLLKAAEYKVGAMVLAVSSLIVYMSLQVTEDPTFFSGKEKAWFLLKDANGLVKGSAVKTAGIPVGVIKDIRLQDGLARIDLVIRAGQPLTSSARVEVKSQGILGDKHLEIYPGSPTDPPLGKDGQIILVYEKGSLDNVIGQIGEIASNLKTVTQNLQEAVSDDGTRKHVLGRIVLNIEKLTSDVAELTSDNKKKISEVIDQIHGISKTLDETLNDPSDKGFKETWKRTLARIDSTLKNIDEISSKINRGEGTIGRLINDEQTVEELNTAIEGVSSFLDVGNKLQTGLDFNSAYLGLAGGARTSIGIRLQPGLDRFYYLGIIDDPAGVIETTNTVSTTASGSTELTEVKTYRNKTKFTVMLGKNFYDFTVRGGLIENTGGIGFDYTLLQDRFKLSLELLNFGRLNVRPQMQYNLWRGIYLLGGYNDALNRSSSASYYVGAGLFITNDDLKLLTTRLPLMN